LRNKGLLITILLLTGISFLAVTVYKTETEKRKTKEDLIELSKIKYGLFSVDEWKRILSDIITKKIEEFNLEGANKEKMRKELEEFLYRQISDLEERYYEEKSQSLFGFIIQNPVTAITGVFGKIKRDIPIFTEGILNFLNDPKNRKAIRGYIINKLNEYADKTFSKIDYTTHDKIIAEYGFENRDVALSGLKFKIEKLDNESRPYQVGLIILGIITGLFLGFSKRFSKVEYLLLTSICFIFLLAGLLLPMIEIDARVAEMSFNLLGEPIIFQDQVLYYKSKSILEVVKLMMTQSRIDLIFVGLLVLTFSVLFPVTKLVSSILYLKSKDFETNKFIQFMIFRTGKWSMADVMVIAIFMAYIGFSGIITEQLKQIENITQNIDILTTNKSSLLTGFYAFTSFAILSLLTSHRLQYEINGQDSRVSNKDL
jgi:hypothetical protein